VAAPRTHLFHLLVGGLFAAAAGGPCPLAGAQVGESANGLPGLVRVPSHEPRASDRPVTLAGTAGYGFTESVLPGGGDRHHQLSGSLGLGWRPFPWLGASVSVDARYDRHTGDRPELEDDGLVGVPTLALRAGHALTDSVSLGAQVAVWFPGQDAPSIVGDAISADVEAFTTVHPSDAVSLAVRAGWRFDESPDSVERPQDLSAPDRMALGVSDADAVLLGVGVSARLRPDLEVLAETTWDLLVGEAAPAAGASPLRLSGGIRFRPLSGAQRDRLELQALLEGHLGGRPDLSDPDGPLVPVEPRVRAVLGLTARLGGPSPEPAESAPDDAPQAPVPLAPPPATLRVAVVDAETGEPLDGAVAETTLADPEVRGEGRRATAPLEQDAAGPGILVGANLVAARWTLAIARDGYEPQERTVALLPGEVLPVRVALAPIPPPAPPAGELRGVVRSYSGRSIDATVRVEGLDEASARTDGNGVFELTLPPGEHTVIIEASRYRTQARRVQVEDGGVTILNADLRRDRGRRRRRR